MKTKIAIQGISLNNDKKFEEKEISYKYQSDEKVNGFGRLVTKGVANVLIDSYQEHLKKNNDQKQPRSVTFGKESLLNLLLQEGCEGIKFYFGKRSKSMWAKECKYSDYEGVTLVAVGVDLNNNDLGTNGVNITSRSLAVQGDDEEVRIYEVVPPDPKP